jgi:hypothetical protein
MVSEALCAVWTAVVFCVSLAAVVNIIFGPCVGGLFDVLGLKYVCCAFGLSCRSMWALQLHLGMQSYCIHDTLCLLPCALVLRLMLLGNCCSYYRALDAPKTGREVIIPYCYKSALDSQLPPWHSRCAEV